MKLNINLIAGLVSLVLGAVLLTLAYHASNAPIEQLSNTLTGHYSDQTTLYIAVGVVGVVGGAFLLLISGRRMS